MNNEKQTTVEWLHSEYIKIFGELNPSTGKLYEIAYALEQAKQMEKEQMKEVIKTEIKLIGNYFDVDKLEQREQGHHIRFTSILKDRFDYYNK